MKEPASPCVGCPDRKVGCHSTCDGYAEWKAKYQEYKRWLWNNRHPLIKQYIDKKHRGEKR